MWMRLKSVRKRQKAAVEKALMKKQENEEELILMEKKMMEEVDKEYHDLMQALRRQQEKKKLEVAEKVKKERQAIVEQSVPDNLEKEHKAEEGTLIAKMWKQEKQENKFKFKVKNYVLQIFENQNMFISASTNLSGIFGCD